jgi:excinuclease ABC subunit C
MALRDEAHRFAVAFHRKKRKARTLSSPLLAIPGVGKKRRLTLVKHFGSIQALKQASLEDIQAVPGFPGNVAERVFQFLQSMDATKDSPSNP